MQPRGASGSAAPRKGRAAPAEAAPPSADAQRKLRATSLSVPYPGDEFLQLDGRNGPLTPPLVPLGGGATASAGQGRPQTLGGVLPTHVVRNCGDRLDGRASALPGAAPYTGLSIRTQSPTNSPFSPPSSAGSERSGAAGAWQHPTVTAWVLPGVRSGSMCVGSMQTSSRTSESWLSPMEVPGGHYSPASGSPFQTSVPVERPDFGDFHSPAVPPPPQKRSHRSPARGKTMRQSPSPQPTHKGPGALPQTPRTRAPGSSSRCAMPLSPPPPPPFSTPPPARCVPRAHAEAAAPLTVAHVVPQQRRDGLPSPWPVSASQPQKKPRQDRSGGVSPVPSSPPQPYGGAPVFRPPSQATSASPATPMNARQTAPPARQGSATAAPGEPIATHVTAPKRSANSPSRRTPETVAPTADDGRRSRKGAAGVVCSHGSLLSDSTLTQTSMTDGRRDEDVSSSGGTDDANGLRRRRSAARALAGEPPVSLPGSTDVSLDADGGLLRPLSHSLSSSQISSYARVPSHTAAPSHVSTSGHGALANRDSSGAAEAGERSRSVLAAAQAPVPLAEVALFSPAQDAVVTAVLSARLRVIEESRYAAVREPRPATPGTAAPPVVASPVVASPVVASPVAAAPKGPSAERPSKRSNTASGSRFNTPQSQHSRAPPQRCTPHRGSKAAAVSPAVTPEGKTAGAAKPRVTLSAEQSNRIKQQRRREFYSWNTMLRKQAEGDENAV